MTRLGIDKSALVLVDMQPDLMPGGTLPVPEGEQILGPVRALMESAGFGVIVATQDWHPPGHASFASRHPGHHPFDIIQWHGHPQRLWPDHCVQGTPGAELHPDLPWNVVSAIVRKGTDLDCDSYSGFRNNWNADGLRPSTGLAGYLRDRGVEEMVLCGLARDYCVKWTAEDGTHDGFRVRVLWDLTRPVDPASDEEVRQQLSACGVEIVTSWGH
jgi:nicotinamidase/pyrazinamidase